MSLVYNNKCQIDYSTLIKEYMPLVKKISSSIHKKINFSVEIDDLMQAGHIGLMEALQKYVPTDTAKFETYATTRIRGSILDDLRKNDPLSQEDRSLYRKIEEVSIKLKQQNNGKLIAEEVAKLCEITVDDYFSIVNKNQIYSILSFEETEDYLNVRSDEEDPEEVVSKKEMMKKIAKEISNLSEKEKIVMQLIYVEDLDAKDVAFVMKITPARVSQIHAKALQQLKINIKN